MRNIIVFLAILAAFSFSYSADKAAKNEWVSFQVRLKDKTTKQGKENALLISLHPKEGIHINLTPPISIRFDSNDAFRIDIALVLPKNPKNAYLDTSKNIEQEFTVSKNAKAGSLTIKGVLTYYYCSDAEGWCSKFKQPFEVPVKITK